MQEIREVVDSVLPPQFAQMITVIHQPFFQPIFDLESTRLTFGRVVLLGDFAFVAQLLTAKERGTAAPSAPLQKRVCVGWDWHARRRSQPASLPRTNQSVRPTP
jgi:ketosteroid isomerase-like protein